MNPSDEPDERDDEQRGWAGEELERASENVLDGWPSAQLEDPPHDPGPVTAFDATKARSTSLIRSRLPSLSRTRRLLLPPRATTSHPPSPSASRSRTR